MPALQVREFPDDLYEKLKMMAASEHRSIAQQTIVAVEQMIDRCNGDSHGRKGRCDEDGARSGRSGDALGYDSESERVRRIEKRKKIFADLDTTEWGGVPPDSDEIVRTIHEERDQRDAQVLGSIGDVTLGEPGERVCL